MQSSAIKYGIIALGVLFLSSTAEVSSEECQQYFNTESHVFIGTESLSLIVGTGGLISPVVKFSPSAIVPLGIASHTALCCIETDEPPGRHPAHLGVPLYLNISSLRI